ncbi:hypothetical protein D3C81_1525270 [compost metagenome]
MHRHTLLVEDLDAALGATRGLLRHREDAGPAAHEQAQVDIGRYHQPHLTVGHHRNFAVVAFTLMHAMLVAGQRHDVAQLAQRRQQAGPLRAQAHRIDAQAAGGELGLADGQALGGIPGTQARLFGTQALPGLVERGNRSGIQGMQGHQKLLVKSATRRQGELNGNVHAARHRLAVQCLGAKAPGGDRIHGRPVQAFHA